MKSVLLSYSAVQTPKRIFAIKKLQVEQEVNVSINYLNLFPSISPLILLAAV